MTFLIYLWTRVDTLVSMTTSICIAIGVLLGMFVFLLPVMDELTGISLKPTTIIKKALIAFSLCLLVIIATPSQKDIVLIYTIPKVLESKTTAELMDTVNLLPKAFRKYVEEYLADGDGTPPANPSGGDNAL